MTTALSGRLTVNIAAEIVDTLDVGQVSYPVNYGANYVFADGDAADKAKKIFTDTRTLTASSTENLDFAGVLTDALGVVLTFTKVKALIIKADAANVNDVVIGGHATAALVGFFGDATDKIKVKPGGTIALIAPDATGYPVIATTGDLLTVANSGAGTSVTYTIIVVGVV